MSGGWKQRLALGACILPDPDLLLLDEPTAGVDPKARREFWGEIHKFAAAGMTALVSTHCMDEAERCHEIAYIAFGELLAQGTIHDVIAASGLRTYTVSGPHVMQLAEKLLGTPGVDRHQGPSQSKVLRKRRTASAMANSMRPSSASASRWRS